MHYFHNNESNKRKIHGVPVFTYIKKKSRTVCILSSIKKHFIELIYFFPKTFFSSHSYKFHTLYVCSTRSEEEEGEKNLNFIHNTDGSSKLDTASYITLLVGKQHEKYVNIEKEMALRCLLDYTRCAVTEFLITSLMVFHLNNICAYISTVVF